MRYAYIAHAGKSIYEYSKIILLLPPFSKFIKNKPVFYELFNERHNTIDNDILSYKDLIEVLCKSVEEKISELHAQLDPIIENINLDKFYKIFKKRKVLRSRDFK